MEDQKIISFLNSSRFLKGFIYKKNKKDEGFFLVFLIPLIYNHIVFFFMLLSSSNIIIPYRFLIIGIFYLYERSVINLASKTLKIMLNPTNHFQADIVLL